MARLKVTLPSARVPIRLADGRWLYIRKQRPDGILIARPFLPKGEPFPARFAIGEYVEVAPSSLEDKSKPVRFRIHSLSKRDVELKRVPILEVVKVGG